jgi:hypothetical protein
MWHEGGRQEVPLLRQGQVNDAQAISDGEYVEHFLASEAWQRTYERLKGRYADQVLAAPNAEAATRLWQKTQVLADVLGELVVARNNGEVVKAKQKHAAAKADAEKYRKK